MLGWEQVHAGKMLHAYTGSTRLPVCGDTTATRSDGERSIYIGPMPPPPELICQKCKIYERENDPMFQEGRAHERGLIFRALIDECNRITTPSQSKEYPNLVLDAVASNLMAGRYEKISVPEPSHCGANPSCRGYSCDCPCSSCNPKR